MSLLHKIYVLTTFAHTWMTIYLCAWRLICSYSWILGCSHALMVVLKSYGDWMIRCMCTWMLKYSFACMFNALLITCSHVYLLLWSFAHMSTCLNDHMLLYSHASMFTFFDDYLLLCWNALMTACLRTLIFTYLRSTHMCTHVVHEMYIGLEA